MHNFFRVTLKRTTSAFGIVLYPAGFCRVRFKRLSLQSFADVRQVRRGNMLARPTCTKAGVDFRWGEPLAKLRAHGVKFLGCEVRRHADLLATLRVRQITDVENLEPSSD